MLKLENAFLVDICLGSSLGKYWFPTSLSNLKQEQIPSTYLMKGEQLATARELVNRGDKSVQRIVDGLRNQADHYFAMPNLSVTQKTSTPPNVGLNDYYSLAKYWWPNPDTEGGMPYIRRDGEINPECYSTKSDLNRLENFTEAVLVLSVAAFVVNDLSYAAKSYDLIKTWIIDDLTRQTPHFEFAQMIPGHMKGRYQGIVEARRLIYVCESIQLLRHLEVISDQDFDKCVDWYKRLLNWLEESEIGIKASQARNNIGFWYDLQRLIYARFCRDVDKAENIIRNSVLPRIEEQIDVDGKLPQELLRAKPYDYVAFTLLAMAALSASGNLGEINLAEYSTEEGKSFQNAFNWLNETFSANELQEKSFAIAQLTIARQELNLLKDENQKLKLSHRLLEEKTKLLKAELIQSSTSSTAFIEEDHVIANQLNNSNSMDDVYHRLATRIQDLEMENNELLSNQNEYYRQLVELMIIYRGAEALLEEQAKLIKRNDSENGKANEELQNLLEEALNAREEIQRLYEDTIKDRMEIQNLYEEALKAKLETQNQYEESLNLIHEYQETVKNKEELLLQLQNELSDLKNQIEEFHHKLDVEKERNEQLREENERIKLINESNKERLDHVTHQLNLIKGSRSWRYMSPLRTVGTLVRRVIKGKANQNKKIVLKNAKQTSELKKAEKKNDELTTNKKESELKTSASKNDDPVSIIRASIPRDIDSLQAEYIAKNLDKQPDTFVLYRILGNDLYPRHKKGQTRENLKFILENEPVLENCEKRWIINRIIDEDERNAIIDLLNQYQQKYIEIPFIKEEYRKIDFDTHGLSKTEYFERIDYNNLVPEQKDRAIGATYRLKNNYVMNNNGARNLALRDGKKHAKWVLPWDGNCYITSSAWQQIQSDVTQTPYLKYFVVPMTRVTDNTQLLKTSFVPDPVEEPQLIFRVDSREEFNEQFCYGRRPKVELFWRLGIPGKWDRWKDDPWDQKRRPLSEEAYQFGVAGWVARLNSGMAALEQDNKQSFKQRGLVRLDAIISTLNYVDDLVSADNLQWKALTNLNDEVLNKERDHYHSGEDSPLAKVIDKLIIDAEEALTRGPYSVVDKTTLPPSGNVNDYWHPAPYWWPNPDTEDGLPYIQRDGERIPGTRMYEPESEKYDRTRLQRVFDDSIILALAWHFTNDLRYANHGKRILERFFVNPETGMTPHLDYAQVRMGRNNNKGVSTGIIEMKDLYFYLDAVRLFIRAGVLSNEILSDFKKWLKKYLEWLIHSPQGEKERSAINNHGTYYDLQVASIAAFLDDYSIVMETFERAKSRISQQFDKNGSQPHELTRTTTAHYCCFNFQGWINLAEIASRYNIDLWKFEAQNGSNLRSGAEWLLSFVGKKWPFEQINEFDEERYLPIWFASSDFLFDKNIIAQLDKSKYDVKPVFFPHDGIRPYWNLSMCTK